MIMSILLQLCIWSARLLPLNWTYILSSGPFLGEYILSFCALHGRGNPLQLLDSTNSPSRNPGYGPEQCLYNTITNFANGGHVGMSWDEASFMTYSAAFPLNSRASFSIQHIAWVADQTTCWMHKWILLSIQLLIMQISHHFNEWFSSHTTYSHKHFNHFPVFIFNDNIQRCFLILSIL